MDDVAIHCIHITHHHFIGPHWLKYIIENKIVTYQVISICIRYPSSHVALLRTRIMKVNNVYVCVHVLLK